MRGQEELDRVPQCIMSSLYTCGAWSVCQVPAGVINRLDPIEELYNMYSEEEDTPRIVEVVDDGLDFDSDVEGPADPYMDL